MMRDRRIVLAFAVVVLVAAAATAMVRMTGREQNRQAVVARPVETARPVAAAAPREQTLYCEFYNFVGRTPKVGFYFAVPQEPTSPAYAQIFQKEIDGTQTDFGTEDRPRPAWAFDGSDSPATLRSPDDAIQINLYGYKPVTTTTWFEAGLRSVQYLNLDGKCRRSPA